LLTSIDSLVDRNSFDVHGRKVANNKAGKKYASLITGYVFDLQVEARHRLASQPPAPSRASPSQAICQTFVATLGSFSDRRTAAGGTASTVPFAARKIATHRNI
jgi:hypothetical protein